MRWFGDPQNPQLPSFSFFKSHLPCNRIATSLASSYVSVNPFGLLRKHHPHEIVFIKKKKIITKLQVCRYCFFLYKLSGSFPPNWGSSSLLLLNHWPCSVSQTFLWKRWALCCCIPISSNFSQPSGLFSLSFLFQSPNLRGLEKAVH